MTDFIIYKFTNKKNGKIYIGKTTRSLAKRISDHVYKAKKGYKDKFHTALLRYGLENFEVEIIHTCRNKKQLTACEINCIKKYNTIDNGYNTQARR